MNALNTKLILALTFASTLFAGVAHADKEPLRIDFNQMIEQNTQTNQELQRGVLQAASNGAATNATSPGGRAQASDERRNVIDFIDMEVGVGDGGAVVGRR